MLKASYSWRGNKITRKRIPRINDTVTKLFNTNNMQIIEFYREQFNFILPSRQIANRRDKFIKSESQRTNLLTFINM